MFDFNVIDIKNKILDETIKEYENSISTINDNTTDSLMEFSAKTTTYIFGVVLQLIEENNKAIWDDLVKRGIINE